MKYWPASALADAPGCHPKAAEDLRNANLKGVETNPKVADAAFVIVSHGMVIGQYQPVAMPPKHPDADELVSLVYLRMPSPWEWRSLERAGMIEAADGYYYFLQSALH